MSVHLSSDAGCHRRAVVDKPCRPRRRTVMQRSTYWLLRHVARLCAVVFWGMKVVGRQHIPGEGAGLVCCNHQSVLDPILVGLQFNRRLNYLARRSLFDNPALGRLIRFLDAIAIDREGLGLEGLRETLRCLQAGELVLIFPEGTRSPDGELQRLKPGLCAVAKRAEAPLLPVAIDGAHRSWPRHRRWPAPARIAVAFGPPIPAESSRQLSADELLAELERRMRECHRQARQLRLS